MKTPVLITLPLLLIPILPLVASDTDQAAHPEEQPGVWDQTRETAKDWWQRSREAAEDAWTDTRDTAGEVWGDTRDAGEKAWEGTRGLLETQEPDRFGQVWDQVLPKLEETLTLQERQAELPESAWFGDDQESNQEAINALLDEAVDILSLSNVQRYRDRIRALQAETAKARQEIADYRLQRVSAPESSMVEKTVADYDRAIRKRQAAVARFEEELAGIRREFAAGLREMGLELEDAQVELLLATVVGDNLVDLGIVFDNVKAITAQLERLVESSGEDLQSARRYYGMYVVLLKSLSQMHLQIERLIAERYVPQIDGIIAKAGRLGEETRALREQSPDQAELLAANLEAQQLTIQAAGVYRRYLLDQGKEVADGRRQLDRDIAAAWNTYETVRVSGELVDLVKSSRKLLDGLLHRQVPALRPFGNLEMKREFEKLTAQLRGQEST
jgi:hypothetical protein